jgi:hypothetical protein
MLRLVQRGGIIGGSQAFMVIQSKIEEGIHGISLDGWHMILLSHGVLWEIIMICYHQMTNEGEQLNLIGSLEAFVQLCKIADL